LNFLKQQAVQRKTFTLPTPTPPPKNMQQTFVLHTQNSVSFVLHTQKQRAKKQAQKSWQKGYKKGGKKAAKKRQKSGKKVGKKMPKKPHCHIHNTHANHQLRGIRTYFSDT